MTTPTDPCHEMLSAVDAAFARTAWRTGYTAPAAEVRAALAAVPRDRFLPAGMRSRAWDDAAQPIDCGQTISQPFIVALMTTALELGNGARVLEVGTGSGYQAAVLAQLAREVFTVEIVPELAATARQRLLQLGCDNVHVRWGDGGLGWPEHAPYDGILVTAGGPRLPPALAQQLRPGARLVAPVGERGDQRLVVARRRPDGGLDVTELLPVVFVPLTGSAR